MERTNQLESTYAIIVETKEELFEMISKQLSRNKNSGQTMARIAVVS